MPDNEDSTRQLNTIEYLKKLTEIPIENVMRGAMMYGANSPYGILMAEAEEFIAANLSPIILYHREGDEALVTSEEYMGRKFN